MNKLDLQTPDFVAENAARLAELFPNCLTESRDPKTGKIKPAIDFDLLRQELSHDLVEGPQERYRLDWPGKREALATANTPTRKTLRPAREESVDFDSTQNLYIEGDNLDALKLLQETYLGKVKMIYIDPPYNTGNDFIYDDNFSISREEYNDLAGTRDEQGNAMFHEEKWKQNSSANGRFHSEWLSMIYPRLKLARNLLAEDGVIFISIDDGEVANLRRMCDEVFGEKNFIAQLIWERAYSPKNDAKYISNSHDYVIMFTKNIFNFTIGRLPRTEEANARYQNPDNDPRGVWKPSDMSVKTYNEECDYPITTPSGRVIEPPTGRCWSLSKKTFFERLADQRIYFGKDGNSVPCIKRFLSELKFEGMAPTSIMGYKEVGHSQEGSKEVTTLLNSGSFDGPKPVRLLKRLGVLSNLNSNSIILDFFSGSATTAHAVMQLNAEDGGQRRHIMVQLPEPCAEKSEAFKAGYHTIAEIGKERIRRAGYHIEQTLENNVHLSQSRLKSLQYSLHQLLHPTPAAESDSEKKPKKAPLTPEQIAEKTQQLEQQISHEQTELAKHQQRLATFDPGFRVLKIDSSNMADVYYQPDQLTQDALLLQVDNLKPDRKPEDLLFQVLLDWGVDLALPITEETILTHRVFFVADNALAACFDTGLDEEFVKILAKRQPLRVVFRDSSYASDAVKINFEQIFKALSPHTELKTL